MHKELMKWFWENKLIKGCLVTALVWFFFRFLFSLSMKKVDFEEIQYEKEYYQFLKRYNEN